MSLLVNAVDNTARHYPLGIDVDSTSLLFYFQKYRAFHLRMQTA